MLGGAAGYLDGPIASALIRNPSGLALDASGNLYFADSGNRRLRRISSDFTTVTTVAGSGTNGFLDGAGASARFGAIEDIAVDANKIYVADASNHRLRLITIVSGNATVTTLAGSGTVGDTVGAALSSNLNTPRSIALMPSGDIYFSDSLNHKIKKLSSGQVTTFTGTAAGYADGDENRARLNQPSGILTNNGKLLLVDYANHNLREILIGETYSKPDVYTIAGNNVAGNLDGVFGTARLSRPRSIVKDSLGNLFITDSSNHQVKKIDTSGNMTSFVGGTTAGFVDDTGAAARFNNPVDIVIDSSDNLYVADSGNHRIRKITPSGVVTTIAGTGIAGFLDGPDLAANLNSPRGLAINSLGEIFIADTNNHRIRKLAAGQVTTIAGAGAAFVDGDASRFNAPNDVALDNDGNIVVADTSNHAIRKLQFQNGKWIATTLAGGFSAGYKDGIASEALFSGPLNVTVDSTGKIYISDTNNRRIRRLNSNTVETIAGSGLYGFADLNLANSAFMLPEGLLIDNNKLLVADRDNSRIREINLSAFSSSSSNNPESNFEMITLLGQTGTAGYFDGTVEVARVNRPHGMVFDNAGNLYIADRNNNRIRKISTSGFVSNFAGSGTAGLLDGNKDTARFNQPIDLVFDSTGNLYVSDYGNHVIRKIDTSGIVSIFAGDNLNPGFINDTGTSARMRNPLGLAIDSSNNLYVAEWGNHVIRKITPGAVVTTFAGTGTAGYIDGAANIARFNRPWGLVIKNTGEIFVSDTSNHKIRKLTSTGQVSTFAGGNVAGFKDGDGQDALFNTPGFIKFDNSGNLVVADSENHRLRKINNSGAVTSLAGTGVAGYKDASLEESIMVRPRGLAMAGDQIYISEDTVNRIRVIQEKDIPDPIIVPPIVIQPVNKRPTLILLNEIEFDQLNSFKLREGINLNLKVFAYDAEDGYNVIKTMTWTSTLQGLLGTGNKVLDTSVLRAGKHDIIIKAIDGQGLAEILSFSLVVIAKDEDLGDGSGGGADRNGDGKVDEQDKVVEPLKVNDKIVKIMKPNKNIRSRNSKLKAVAFELTETNQVQNDVSEQIIWEFSKNGEDEELREFVSQGKSVSLNKLPRGLIKLYARVNDVESSTSLRINANKVELLE
ncbi:MAG: hypothetical protein LW817_06110 [Candidatus Caenarcaniphilales bacterium]|nr:hypothetical protein [Candidatus Caenarcaniphilales bacterium]